jgi:deazaflavin-dependent oxidoreductase (nitroreductase family)
LKSSEEMAKTKFTFWKLLKYPPQLIYAIGLGPIYGRLVLLLTTTGRKSGKPRVTPLQYEEIDGDIYIGSARGTKADWWRNIVANPIVWVQIKSRKFEGKAELVTDLKRIADFLEYRLQKHPKMIGAIMRREGLPKNHTRLDLENYATNRAIVIIKPNKEI